MEDDFDIGSFLGGGGGDASTMVSPYPSDTYTGAPAGMVNPYPSNYGGGAPSTGIDPEVQSWMQMLGMGGGQQQQGGGTGGAPNVAAPAAPQATPNGALPQGSLNPLLQLGITGQKAQQGAYVPDMTSTNYTAPQNPTTSSSGGGIGGSGIGGLTGNSGSKGVGTASVPITAFFGGF